MTPAFAVAAGCPITPLRGAIGATCGRSKRRRFGCRRTAKLRALTCGICLSAAPWRGASYAARRRLLWPQVAPITPLRGAIGATCGRSKRRRFGCRRTAKLRALTCGICLSAAPWRGASYAARRRLLWPQVALITPLRGAIGATCGRSKRRRSGCRRTAKLRALTCGICLSAAPWRGASYARRRRLLWPQVALITRYAGQSGQPADAANAGGLAAAGQPNFVPDLRHLSERSALARSETPDVCCGRRLPRLPATRGNRGNLRTQQTPAVWLPQDSQTSCSDLRHLSERSALARAS